MPAFSLGALGVEARDAGVASAITGTAQHVGGSIGAALPNTVAGATAGYLASHRGSADLTGRSLVHGSRSPWGPGRGRIIRGRIVRRGNAQDRELQHTQ